MYLSKPILFIIIVVVLVVGGTSKLMYEDVGDSDSDSYSDSSVSSVSSVSSGSEDGDGGSKREGAVGSRTKPICKPGCSAASAASGNCKWLPKYKGVPKSQQRYICPHTCDIAKGSNGAGGCETDMDCSDCTPQKDYTADAYASMGVSKGSNTCVKGAECAINSAFRGLTICNPEDAPNLGENNLICAKDPKSALSDDPNFKPRYVWTDAKSAAEAIPYTTSQNALLSCDVKRACANDGDSCIDAEGKRIFCKNNLWLGDPKYDKDQYDSKSNTNNANNGDNDTGVAKNDKRKSGSGSDANDDTIRDNYYITNYFYGPSKQKRENRIIPNPIKKVVRTTGNVVDKVASGIKGAYNDIKSTFTAPLPKQMNYGVNGGRGGGVSGGGNTLVPSLVPKGTVASVQPYESSIRL